MSAELVRRAREVMRNAHAPYSRFHVGAALEAADGRVFVGTNVAAGAKQFTRIAVTAAVDPPAAPCGACRQLLAEFGLDLEVISAGPKSERRWTLGELLPAAFTRESLDT